MIYRTRTASLDEPELDRVADDLRQFLEQLERSLTGFVANGEPGCLELGPQHFIVSAAVKGGLMWQACADGRGERRCR